MTPAPAGVERELIDWLRAFEARRGRPLRVLHVGNIANNAYLNAKFLRSVGVDAHVVCHDYEHVMATPEWEDVELLHGHGDDFLPRFSKRDLRGYRRPAWFVSGPLLACVARIARLSGERPVRLLSAARALGTRAILLATRLFGPLVGHGTQLLIVRPRLFLYKLIGYLCLRLGVKAQAKALLSRLSRGPRPALQADAPTAPAAQEANALDPLIAAFDEAFPRRPDRLTAEDLFPFQATAALFEAMFRHYDVVQCYATEPIHALVAGKRPHVAYEHGTLREFTMADSPLHRLTALSYRRADHVFITNGDCVEYARRLGIETHGPMIHPVDVEQHRRDYGTAIAELRAAIDADVVLFCPARHDWEIKGTDRFIRALPLLKRRLSGRVKLVLVEWGRQIRDAKGLLDELGCARDVVWKRSLCRVAMIKHMRAADVVLDQMILPVFGAIAPQAISAGKPVVASYIPEQTSWLMPEPAPILSAFSPEDVAEAVVRALDPAWLAGYAARARHWVDAYHHPNIVISGHLRAYRRVLEGAASVPTRTRSEALS